jgi:hypothetical protein
LAFETLGLELASAKIKNKKKSGPVDSLKKVGNTQGLSFSVFFE